MAFELVEDEPKKGRFELVEDDRPKGSGSTAVDAGNAVGTGFFRGLTQLAGLPADTAYNIRDLGKAALGTAYQAATGRAAPDALSVGDRSRDIGSGQWLQNQMRRTAPTRGMIDPVNPEYEGGYLQSAGGALSGVANPGTRGELAGQVLNNVLSSTAGKAVYDATGSPELAIAASMSPLAAQQALAAGTKYAIRGDEKGRQQMAQRIQDLKAAGVENPTLGLASGNQMIGGVENLLQQTPGAIGVMRRAREEALGGLQGTNERAANAASINRGSLESGQAIQAGLRQFRDEFKGNQSALYDRLDQFIPPRTPVNVEATKRTLAALNADIPGAPELSKQFKNSQIQSIERALLADIGETAKGSPVSITSPVFGRVEPVGVDMMGRPVYRGDQVGTSRQSGASIEGRTPTKTDMMGRQVPISGAEAQRIGIPGGDVPIYGRVPMRTDSMGRVVPQEPVVGERTTRIDPMLTSAFSGVGVLPTPSNTLPFEAMKKTRTLVGNEIADANLASSVPRSKWNPLYAALSDDLQAAARQAGPEASGAFNRANDFTRSGMQRIERVQPFADATSPERAFQMLERTLPDGVSTLQAVKKSLPEGARGQVAGTVIERLGKATPGQQNEMGTNWSPETFLTNWNRMNPRARDELVSGFPNADKVKADIDAVAKATSMMRDNSKMWANPSGTGANTAARGLLGLVGVGGLGAAGGLLNPLIPVGAATGLLGANAAARGLTNQGVVNAAASRTTLDPRLVDAQVRGMIGSGLLNYSPQQ
jgi:hypothetical protein